MYVIKNLKSKIEKFWEYGSGRTVLAAICAHSVSVSIGICQGYSAILIPQLIASPKYRITMEESSWLAGLGAITNPFGSIASGVLAEYMGRKMAIQMTTIPFLVGWLCIGLANDLEWIYLGRLITGIAAGIPYHHGIMQWNLLNFWCSFLKKIKDYSPCAVRFIIYDWTQNVQYINKLKLRILFNLVIV